MEWCLKHKGNFAFPMHCEQHVTLGEWKTHQGKVLNFAKCGQ